MASETHQGRLSRPHRNWSDRGSQRKTGLLSQAPITPADRGLDCQRSGPTPAPQEARCDLRTGDLGERQRPQAPTVRLTRPSKKEQDPALACLLEDPDRTHDRSPVANLCSVHNLHPDAQADVDQSTRSPAKWSIVVQQVTSLIDPMTGTRDRGFIEAWASTDLLYFPEALSRSMGRC